MTSISIEVIVVLAAGPMVVGFFLDHFRRRTRNKIFIFVYIFVNSRILFLQYLIGRMQLAKKNNDLLQVWAVLLITLQYSIKALRPSGIYGKYNPIQDIMTSFWTANLLGTRATDLQFPLWFLWFLNAVRIVLGFADIELKPRRHIRNIELLTEYMRTEHTVPQTTSDFMHGYNYSVWGEHNQLEIKVQPPTYRVQMTVKEEHKLITIPKVWQSIEQDETRDLSLSFALFKLIRRRFYSYPLHEARLQKTKDFVLGLLGNSTSSDSDYERAFRIIKAEVTFLVDFFYTRYASTFAVGFPKKKCILSFLVISVIFYLGYVVFLHRADLIDHKLSISELMVTGAILFFVFIKECWEIANYLLSDWTKVVKLSRYVEHPWWVRWCPLLVKPCKVANLCTKGLVCQWHDNLWQYNILQSFRIRRIGPLAINPNSQAANFIFRMFTCMKRSPGGKGNLKVRLPSDVKRAIGESVKNLLPSSSNNVYLETYLSNAASSVGLNQDDIVALVNDMKSDASKILVWHIATCYCEINLSTLIDSDSSRARHQEEGNNDESTIKLNLDSPFFIENLDSHAKGLQSRYEAATALSQYAAYLLSSSGYLHLVPNRCGITYAPLLRFIRWKIWRILRKCQSWSEVLNTLNQFIEIDHEGRPESTAEEARGQTAADGRGEEQGEEQGAEIVVEDQEIVVEGDELQGEEMVVEGDELRGEEIVVEDDHQEGDELQGEEMVVEDQEIEVEDDQEGDELQGEEMVVEDDQEGDELQGDEMVIEDQEGDELRGEEIVVEDDQEGEEQGEGRRRRRRRRRTRLEVQNERREAEANKILQQGIKLGQKLMELTADSNYTRWLFLEEFWAGYILYMAASVSPDHHKQSLSTGGEFLTHVWALLSHAGILGPTNQQQAAADGRSTVYHDAHSQLQVED